MDQQEYTSGSQVQSPGVAEPTAIPETASTQVGQASSGLAELRKAVNSGGNWFYWIAGLSLVNTLISMFGGKIAFIVGLGITQVMDAIMSEVGGAVVVIGLTVNLVIVGIYVMFGYFSCRRAKWAFITGMALYSLDALLLLVAKEIPSLVFHGFALYCIFKGFKAEVLAEQKERELGTKIVD